MKIIILCCASRQINFFYNKYIINTKESVNQNLITLLEALHHHLTQLLHLARDPHRQRFVALRIAKESLVCSQPVICPRGLSHFKLILWARRLSKKFASLPNIPSVDTTKGVKDARCTSPAPLHFLF